MLHLRDVKRACGRSARRQRVQEVAWTSSGLCGGSSTNGAVLRRHGFTDDLYMRRHVALALSSVVVVVVITIPAPSLLQNGALLVDGGQVVLACADASGAVETCVILVGE